MRMILILKDLIEQLKCLLSDEIVYNKVRDCVVCGRENALVSVLFPISSRSQHEDVLFVHGKDMFVGEKKKPRLHLNRSCPKDGRGKGAVPDLMFKSPKGDCLVEVKVLSNGNDCELFNGIVQLAEYQQIFKVANGVLLIFICLPEVGRPAYDFVRSLSDKSRGVLIVNVESAGVEGSQCVGFVDKCDVRADNEFEQIRVMPNADSV